MAFSSPSLIGARFILFFCWFGWLCSFLCFYVLWMYLYLSVYGKKGGDRLILTVRIAHKLNALEEISTNTINQQTHQTNQTHDFQNVKCVKPLIVASYTCIHLETEQHTHTHARTPTNTITNALIPTLFFRIALHMLFSVFMRLTLYTANWIFFAIIACKPKILTEISEVLIYRIFDQE